MLIGDWPIGGGRVRRRFGRESALILLLIRGEVKLLKGCRETLIESQSDLVGD